jgi:hypothetical protein
MSLPTLDELLQQHLKERAVEQEPSENKVPEVARPKTLYKASPTEEQPCCKRKCFLTFTESQVLAWRSYGESIVKKERGGEALAIRDTMLLADNQPCCTKYLMWVFGLHPNSLYYKRRGNNRRDKSVKDISVMAWFENLKVTLDQMPDEEVFQVCAPWKKTVYKWYQVDSKEYPSVYVPCTEDYFNKIWRTHFSNLKLRKWLRFTQCGECAKWRAIRWDRKSSRDEKREAIRELVKHYKFIKKERATAHAKAAQAIERPTEVLSIAMDGTDQLPRGLPQFSVDTHDDANANDRIKFKFTLARIHGLDLCCYDHLENIQGDPNLTIEILQRTLKRAEKLLGKLPPQLHIQVDNCFRENKNSYVVNWLATLTERGLFPNGIFLSFLPQGMCFP